MVAVTVLTVAITFMVLGAAVLISANGQYIEQNLENDIINTISKMKGIDLREAFDIYYSSKLAEQISNDSYGIENMDAKYLAEDLIENEPDIFE